MLCRVLRAPAPATSVPTICVENPGASAFMLIVSAEMIGIGVCRLPRIRVLVVDKWDNARV